MDRGAWLATVHGVQRAGPDRAQSLERGDLMMGLLPL